MMKDRDFLEKGTKEFKTHIRAYKEHQCSFIFRQVQNMIISLLCDQEQILLYSCRSKRSKMDFQNRIVVARIDLH